MIVTLNLAMETLARAYLEGHLPLAQVPEVLAWLLTPEGEAFAEHHIRQALETSPIDSGDLSDESANRLFARIRSQLNLEKNDQSGSPEENH